MTDRDTVHPLCEDDGGGFIAYAAGMPGCTGDGATKEEALADLERAKIEWLAASKRMGRS